jgi:glutaredoxin 3
MRRVTMYCTAVCPYCIAAERLLRHKGVMQIDKIRVDREPSRRAEMMQRTGRRTVPQIYVGEQHVGGYDDLAALEHEGRLDSLLGEASGAAGASD